jgi:hypothetical protein
MMSQGYASAYSAPPAQALLYVAYAGGTTNGHVSISTFPQGKLLQTIDGLDSPLGECVDRDGDVFVSNYGSGGSFGAAILKFVHGGSAPVAELKVQGYHPINCADDPTTGDLAVTLNDGGSGNAIAVFLGAQGTPTLYSTPLPVFACTYDDQGDLFIDGNFGAYDPVVLELPKHHSMLNEITLDKALYYVGSLQWDGTHLALQARPTLGDSHGPSLVYRLSISGSQAHTIGIAQLSSGKRDRNPNLPLTQFWIQGKRIVGPMVPHKNIGVWRYPAGGKNRSKIENSGYTVLGITISLPDN